MKIFALTLVLLVSFSLGAVAEEKKGEKDIGFYPSVGLTLGAHGLGENGETGAMLAAHLTAFKLHNARIGGVGVGLRNVSFDPVGNNKTKVAPLIHGITVVLYDDGSGLSLAGSFLYALGEKRGPVIGLTGTF